MQQDFLLLPNGAMCSNSNGEDTGVGDISTPEEIEITYKSETGISKGVKVWKPDSAEVTVLKPEVPTVMVAGRARNGKSTALNNIFGVNLVVRASASSVTSVVNTIKVIKKLPKKRGDSSPQEVTMQVIDTPGLGSLDISKTEILTEMKRITKGINFTLLYCFSVSPNTALTEVDKTIITNLHRTLGKEVWSKCVLLFTFSDHAYLEFEESPAEYIHHINDHAQKFNELLQEISGKESCVKSIFEYESPDVLSEEESPSNIIAIPVKKKVAPCKDILPGMIKSGQDWTDVVFVELMKRADSIQREPFILFKYPNIFISSGTTVAGLLIGGAIGAGVGIIGGPFGVLAGTAAGAAIGGATGGVAGLTIKAVIHLVNVMKKK